MPPIDTKNGGTPAAELYRKEIEPAELTAKHTGLDLEAINCL